MTNILADGNVILLGHVGDSNATAVQFPVADIISSFGDGGSWKLLVLRPNDSEAYEAAVVSVADGVLSWTVSAYDVEQAGNGACQLQYTVDGATKMSQKYRTSTKPSLVDGGGGGTSARSFSVSLSSEVYGEDSFSVYFTDETPTWVDFITSAYNPICNTDGEQGLFTRLFYTYDGIDENVMLNIAGGVALKDENGDIILPNAELTEGTYYATLPH